MSQREAGPDAAVVRGYTAVPSPQEARGPCAAAEHEGHCCGASCRCRSLAAPLCVRPGPRAGAAMKPNQHRGEDRDPGDRRPGKRRVRGCRLRAPKPACNHLKLHRWLPGSADPLVPSGHSSEPSPGFCPLREPGSSASERESAWTESPTAFLFLGSGRGRIQFLGGSVREGRGCWGLFSISTPLPPLQGAVVISTGGPERCQPGDSTSPASPAVKREDGPRSQGCRDPGGRPGWQPLQSLIHGPMRPALHGLRKQLVFLQWRPGLGSWWEGHRCLQGRATPTGLQQHCGPPAAPVGEKQVKSRGSD